MIPDVTKIGNILYSCWGYSMILYSFYEIQGWSDTGKSIYLRRVKSKVLGGDQGDLQVQPDPGNYVDELLTKRVRDDGFIKINSSEYTSIDKIWDGKEIFHEDHLD